MMGESYRWTRNSGEQALLQTTPIRSRVGEVIEKNSFQNLPLFL